MMTIRSPASLHNPLSSQCQYWEIQDFLFLNTVLSAETIVRRDVSFEGVFYVSPCLSEMGLAPFVKLRLPILCRHHAFHINMRRHKSRLCNYTKHQRSSMQPPDRGVKEVFRKGTNLHRNNGSKKRYLKLARSLFRSHYKIMILRDWNLS